MCSSCLARYLTQGPEAYDAPVRVGFTHHLTGSVAGRPEPRTYEHRGDGRDTGDQAGERSTSYTSSAAGWARPFGGGAKGGLCGQIQAEFAAEVETPGRPGRPLAGQDRRRGGLEAAGLGIRAADDQAAGGGLHGQPAHPAPVQFELPRQEIDQRVGAGYRRQCLDPLLTQLRVSCTYIWLQYAHHSLDELCLISSGHKKTIFTVVCHEARTASLRIRGDNRTTNTHRLGQHLCKAFHV